MEQVFIITK